MAMSSQSSMIVKWFDEKIGTGAPQSVMKNRLERLVPKKFNVYEKLEHCINDILKTKADRCVILIVSNGSGSKIVPIISGASCLRSVYVFCGNPKIAEEWTRPYKTLIGGIFTDSNYLVDKIEQDIRSSSLIVAPKSPTVTKESEPIPMSVFRLYDRQRGLTDLQKESAEFIWYQLLIVIVRQLGELPTSKTDMIRAARIEYADNSAVTKKIQEFDKTYNASKAISWYSAASFVYRLLNRALRTANIDTVFQFRFFISDLHKEIMKLHQPHINKPIPRDKNTVYRGQRLRKDEIETIKSNVGGIISMNTFLSTSYDPVVADIYSGIDESEKANGIQSAIFIIKILNRSSNIAPFADIKAFAQNPDEDELLFTIGTIFRVVSAELVNDRWKICLQLIEHTDPSYREFFDYCLGQIGHGCTPLTLGWFLYRMNDFSRAERYAQSLLKQIEDDDIESGNAHNLLGLIYKETGCLSKAIKQYEQALEIFQRCDVSDSPRLIVAHHNIALAYLASEDERTADEHYLKAKDIFDQSSSKNDQLLQSMLEGLSGKIHAACGFMDDAIERLQSVLKTQIKRLPTFHAAVGSTWKDLAIAYFQKGDDKKAFEAFNEALKIFQTILVNNHMDCYECYTYMGQIYYHRQEYELAVSQFGKAYEILTEYARENDEAINKLMGYKEKAFAMVELERERR